MDFILNTYKDFDDNIKNTFNIENTKFEFDINNKFTELVESTLKEVEIIGKNAKYNIYVIDAMKNIDDDVRKELIENIFNLRNIIDNMKNEIINQRKQINLNMIDSEEYNQILNEYYIKSWRY